MTRGAALEAYSGSSPDASCSPSASFFSWFPGPALLVIAVGAVLIAREFKFAARLLDALEV